MTIEDVSSVVRIAVPMIPIGHRDCYRDCVKPVSLADSLSEQHAVAVMDLIRPLLVDGWKISPTAMWGGYVIWKRPPKKTDVSSPSSYFGVATDFFDVVFTFRMDEMKVVVRYRKQPIIGWQDGKFTTVPIEHPNTIELLAQFVLERLSEYAYPQVITLTSS